MKEKTMALKKHKYKSILRKMGYLKDQKGILNRYFRESGGWENHLKNTREYIIQSAKTKEKNYAVILGSGWLLDVPLKELSNQFKKVSLVDIRHPAQIRKKVEKYNNVELIEKDLTGGLIVEMYKIVQDYKKTKEKPLITRMQPSSIAFDNDPDFIVSCNVLSQLNVLLKEYLKRHPVFSNHEIHELDKMIQKKHINLLPKGKSCIITDFEEEIINDNNELIGTNPLLHIALPKLKNKKTWKWHFDTKMFYREDVKTFMNVLGGEIE